ncbi:isoprenylcysteine carboxylmethyltransferase family protein [Kitasatospora aureofaciens]|uniref:methyltransferase family protein n=1 Tax=Kitasatospora aureofaciens TaxID=1894 RepID=UPI001C477CCA|nr:isoprenylcysteine carboxylmethyltransferase family protein [Kitasatospora aureofaciens]MBV6702238.1 isoprenylcysteine carboxylmethyltransferase family protein [Kitasatospora aureofaciens]
MFYAAGFALGRQLHRVRPWPIGARTVTAPAGHAVMLAGAALAVGGATEILRHHSTLVPQREVSALVTTGVYRISRNPMYTGLALVYTGGSLRAGSWWPLVELPAVLLLIRRLVIEPEERYLSSKYGEQYESYRGRVRRWL